jgi:inositol phosphorylceramide glucuronosyltransferase 1
MVAPPPPLALANFSRYDHAVVSSLYTEGYTSAVITLAYSLKRANVKAPLILLYIPSRISLSTTCLVQAAGWTLHPVERIPPPPSRKQVPIGYIDQYTKLHIWTLDTLGIKSLVYLDADTLVRRNFDELFTLPFTFAAVPDVYTFRFELGFNAGMLFIRPNSTIFEDMLSKLAEARYDHGGAEQAFLNVYFAAQVVKLPYSYNANLAIKVRSPKLWQALENEHMHVVHYTLDKPFLVNGHDAVDIEKLEDLEPILQSTKGLRGGMWMDEFGWWEMIWREMMVANRDVFAQCSST